MSSATEINFHTGECHAGWSFLKVLLLCECGVTEAVEDEAEVFMKRESFDSGGDSSHDGGDCESFSNSTSETGELHGAEVITFYNVAINQLVHIK